MGIFKVLCHFKNNQLRRFLMKTFALPHGLDTGDHYMELWVRIALTTSNSHPTDGHLRRQPTKQSR